MKLTKKQQQFIIEAYNSNYVCREWKDRIKETFPKLFKNKLEAGKWYWRDEELMVWNKRNNTYGFNCEGYWHDDYCFSSGNLIPATQEEVEQALIKEAKKRGFKGGLVINQDPLNDDAICGLSDIESYCEDEFYCLDDVWGYRLLLNGRWIFRNGQWAEIVKTITKKKLKRNLDAKSLINSVDA